MAIEFYAGAESMSKGVGDASPDSPKTSSGGPIEVCDGIDNGSSMSVPEKFDNMISDPKNSSGSVIDGPMC